MQYSSFTSGSNINNLRPLSTTRQIRHDRNVRDMNNNCCLTTIRASSDSNSSSSSSRPTRRGFGLPLSDTISTTTTNNTTTKKNNKKKKNNTNKNEPNINTNPASGASRFDSRNKVNAGITTSSSNDLEFDLKLQAIKRSAIGKKKLVQTTQSGAIDYDQPSVPANSDNTDAPKILGLGAKVKIGIGVAVIIFGLVFALGDFLPTVGGDSPREEAIVESQLSVEEKNSLQTRLQQFEAAIIASPKDPTAVEGAAVTLSELGEYSRAASLLEDLIKMKPNDPEAFRLLGEVKYQLKDYEGSAAAYKKSAMVSKSVDFEVLRGLTNALIDGKRPDEAVKIILDSRQRLNAEAASVVVDPVQVELLLGKAYTDWGHVSDAVSVYDHLISTHPDDFRGYLAKGIILKENGRPGDAERMFIQARFFAPEKAKALVDRYARK